MRFLPEKANYADVRVEERSFKCVWPKEYQGGWDGCHVSCRHAVEVKNNIKIVRRTQEEEWCSISVTSLKI
jgi:hypothetical protein